MKIGDPVWVFYENHRVYRPARPGEDGFRGGPIWRAHWQKQTVVGETARSWVLGDGSKVPKKGADHGLFAFSEADIDKRAWVHENRHHISRVVGLIEDHDLLRKVAELIGYENAGA